MKRTIHHSQHMGDSLRFKRSSLRSHRWTQKQAWQDRIGASEERQYVESVHFSDGRSIHFHFGLT